MESKEINEYIVSALPESDDFLKEIEKYAKENYVPIAKKDTAALLNFVAKVKKPKTILEVGTAIGYSTIILGRSLSEDGKIVSIEKDDERAMMAVENLKKAELKGDFRVIVDDAKVVLPLLNEGFDLIFIDAAKGAYLEFFKEAIRLLNKGGVLISDNILYMELIPTGAAERRKHRTIIKNMRQYIDEVVNNPHLETSILPVGDGVMLSVKK